nr:extracellular solute-binding protein [Shimia sp. R10_1]
MPALSEDVPATLYSWRGSVPQDVFDRYTEVYGEDLIVDSFMAADEAEARLALKDAPYDLAVLPIEVVPRLLANNTLQPVKTQVAALKDVAPTLHLDVFDALLPDVSDYVVPYLWGSTGMIIDVPAVRARLPNAPLDSWSLLFDSKNAEALADCGISIVNSSQEVLALTLSYLGKDPNRFSEEALDAAFGTLSQVMPYVSSISDLHYSKLRNGEVCIALVWSVPGVAPKIEGFGEQYTYVLPKEGAIMWSNVLVAPRKREPSAHLQQLLSFVLSEEVFERLAAHSFASMSPFGEDVALSPMQHMLKAEIFPTNQMQRLFMLEPLTGAQKHDLDTRWRRLQIGRYQ